MEECTSDGVRLRVVSYTTQCVRVVCSVSVVCVCVRGVARGLTTLALASTPSLRERPRRTARWTSGTHTPLTSVRAVPGSRATCSPLACLGTKVAAAKCVNPCLADLVTQVSGCSPFSTSARSGGGAHTLAGCIPTHLVALIPSRAVFHRGS